MNHKAFFDYIRLPLFKGEISQAHVDGINTILEAWAKVGDGEPRHLAYILATAHHETGRTFLPLKETGTATNPNPADSLVKQRLTKAFNAGKLTWVKKDYWSGGFFGRGYVQLTHKYGYEKAGKKLGLDLVSDPAKAMIPEIAALILIRGMQEGWFTGKKLADYPFDFVASREIVNGKDRAVLIADYALNYLEAIKAAKEAPIPDPPKPAPVPEKPSIWAVIIRFVLSLFARKAVK